MEVQGTPNPGSIPPRRPRDEGIDLTRVNREGIRQAAEDAFWTRDVGGTPTSSDPSASGSSGGGDRIDLSPEARALLEKSRAQVQEEGTRAERVAELKAQYLAGKLDTPARTER